MKKRIFLLFILAALLLQVTFLDSFKLFWVKPDLLLILTVVAALFLDLKWALVFAALSGMLKDIIAINPFGFNTLIFSLWGYLVSELSRKISIENDALRATLVFLVTLLNAATNYSLGVFLGSCDISMPIFLRVAFLESIYTTAISPLVFAAAKTITN